MPNGAPIVVQLGRVDALRGWLTLDYVRPSPEITDSAR